MGSLSPRGRGSRNPSAHCRAREPSFLLSFKKAPSNTVDSTKAGWLGAPVRATLEEGMAKKDTARDLRLAEGTKVLDQWEITLARLQDHSLTVAELAGQIGR